MAFDAYHLWLGIPSQDQPADNYRLLAIARFEGRRLSYSDQARTRAENTAAGVAELKTALPGCSIQR